MKAKLIKRALSLAAAVLILCGGAWLGYSVGADTAPDEERPEWQRVLEEEIYPLATSSAVSAIAYYVITLSGAKRVKDAALRAELSAAGFDGAASELAQARSALVKSAEENRQLRDEVTAMRAEQERLRQMIADGIHMIGLGFSHEAELVKNGTAREIMEVGERYEEQG